jgi:hypothetical protein
MRRSSTIGILVLVVAVLTNFSAALAYPVIVQQTVDIESTGPHNPNEPDTRF